MSEAEREYVTDQDLQEAMQLLGESEVPESPRGFSSPNFTQIPNDLLDNLMRGMSESELRVILAICRETYGYHRISAKLGIADMAKITGLSYTAVVNGAKEAEARGLIRRTNPDSKTKAEWEIIETPQRSEGYKRKHPNVVRVTPQRSEGQVGLNKDKESQSSKEKRYTSAKIADVPPLPLDWQIATEQEVIVMPTAEQNWQADTDIAVMNICRSGSDLEGLARAFIEKRHLLPKGKRDYKTWASALREMKSYNVTPDILKMAIQRLISAEMTISDPWAVKKTAIDLANPVNPLNLTPAVSNGGFYA